MTTDVKNPGIDRAAAWPMILLGCSYPPLAHLAALSGRPGLIAASIGWLLMLVLLPELRRRKLAAWVVLAAGLAGLYAITGSSAPLRMQFLPPILMFGFMAWVFGHTLRHDRMPLIESIIRALNDPGDSLDEDVLRYARRLTAVWTGLFVLLGAVNTGLALCAEPGGLLLAFGLQPVVTVPLSLWSLFANVVNYLLVAALFVVEFQYRQRRFPHQPYRGLLDFTRRVASLGAMYGHAGAAAQADSTPVETPTADGRS